MAFLLSYLQDEISAVKKDFQEKGAIGLVRDAVLDAKDIIVDAGGVIVDGAKSVSGGGEAIQATAPGDVLPEPGARMKLVHSDKEVEVIAIDTISVPPRAKVRLEDGTNTVVGILPFVEPVKSPEAPQGQENEDKSNWVMDRLNEEITQLREKGAVGTLKEAACEAAELLESAAGSVASLAGKTKSVLEEKSPDEAPPIPSDPAGLDDWYGNDGQLTARGEQTPDGVQGYSIMTPRVPPTPAAGPPKVPKLKLGMPQMMPLGEENEQDLGDDKEVKNRRRSY
eukprot:TRINITY_DN49427_c0_g1_i1.p1 TRINITY_DN49427_c0_g1~~TRINITY_DN49427_c0_g1_i1.p1  ORF type:complete len:301 (+),score=82.41 TRINITY_DN49427_c0_g1_i1:58-903(+)